MTRILLPIFSGCLLLACSGKGGPFGNRTPLQRYAQKLVDADLRETTLGALWLGAYDSSLSAPLAVALPYRQAGYFADVMPRAVSIAFKATRGSGLQIAVEPKSAGPFRLYTELWKQESDGQYRLVHAFDSTKQSYHYEADQETQLLLRLQPQLLQKGAYTLSISVGPSLAFPVPRGRIGSVWGDARDGGVRRHEGIDIFAPRRSAVVAIAPGTISRVETTRRGGKVVWLRPRGRSLHLYYAHLEEQLVQAGAQVAAGDTIGLVGTTGNAKGTPPHLHFGIYARGGALDPKPFVDPSIRKPGAVNELAAGHWMRLRAPLKLDSLSLPEGSVLRVADVSREYAIAYTPDAKKVKVALGNLQTIDNQSLKTNSSIIGRLLDAPSSNAAPQMELSPQSAVLLKGFWGEFALVQYGDTEGWLRRRELR
ncbi:MAG: M23 family metallopeptidase [Chitinophagaceae bacterium]|nr:MAG: M23 family metallopeptidase [Chitinophagaceae bacterium]